VDFIWFPGSAWEPENEGRGSNIQLPRAVYHIVTIQTSEKDFGFTLAAQARKQFTMKKSDLNLESC